MNKLSISIVFLLAICTLLNGQSNTYYISSEGDDNNSGRSVRTAWKSVDRVNQMTFQPGDAILFKSGGEWGGQLYPKGRGEPGRPITISSFGAGAMPVMNIGTAAGVGIQLINQSWWEIDGIEITSGAQPELGIRREGIVVAIDGEESHIEHIAIRNCYIHDLWGQVGGKYAGYAIYIGKHLNSGQESKEYTANDILLENNIIERVDRYGILIEGKNDVVVRGNYLENIGGDGIIVIGAYQGTIEYNIADKTCLRSGDPDLDRGGEEWWPHTAAIWIAACTETVMQFNEVYNTGKQPGNGDGFAYDFDFECKRCILQYNYSANGHGLLLVMDRAYDNIARYNVSQNDQTHLIEIHGNTEDGNIIHNNLFYVDHSTVDITLYSWLDEEEEKAKLGATFRNNIFYAASQGRFRLAYTHGDALQKQFVHEIPEPPYPDGPIFQNNCYFGTWLGGLPDDPGKLLTDPLILAPGTGGFGLSTLECYKLKPDSPCRNAGIFMATDAQKDFYGNPIQDGSADIGIHEHSQE